MQWILYGDIEMDIENHTEATADSEYGDWAMVELLHYITHEFTVL